MANPVAMALALGGVVVLSLALMRLQDALDRRAKRRATADRAAYRLGRPGPSLGLVEPRAGHTAKTTHVGFLDGCPACRRTR